MGISIESRRGRAALMAAHCAGLVDLVALPVWVGTLISRYGFDPQQAGGLATLFLFGVVLAGAVCAPLFHRLSGRWVASLGFGTSAVGFWLAADVTAFADMAVLHALCGVATGAALSMTHRTAARSAHPHRLFAMMGTALGVFAIVFLAATPQLIEVVGGPALFHAFAASMGVAGVAGLLAFPSADAVAASGSRSTTRPQPVPRAVWAGIVGIAFMALVQAMTFSMLERVGADRGFDRAALNGVLIALGLVNLLPAALAALLEKRWPARHVLLAGPVVQATLSAVVMVSPVFPPYAVAAALFASVMIFTHTFAFGLLARLDPSGRSLAASPAMMMIGSAIGPVLGGTLVKAHGYEALALAAAGLAMVAVFCFSRLPSAAATSANGREVMA
jgi:predicted MFS family arabinose efflux permease